MLRAPLHLARCKLTRITPNPSSDFLRESYVLPSLKRFSRLNVPLSATLSTGLESETTEQQPRKPRRIFRKLLLVLVGSSAAVAGLLYTSKYFRDQLVQQYPPAQSILAQIESLIGGWYDEYPSKTPIEPPAKEFTLPFLSDSLETRIRAVPSTVQSAEPKKPEKAAVVPSPEIESKEEPEAPPSERSLPELPSFEDVKQMVRQRAQAVPATVDVSKAISDATHAVQMAISSLESLSNSTRSHIDGLREAMRSDNENMGRSREKKWEHVSRLAALKDKAETKANETVDEAKKQLEHLQEAMEAYKLAEHYLDSDLFPRGVTSHSKLMYDLDGAILEVRKLQNELSMLMRYRDLASKTHEALQKDLADIHEHTDLDKASKDGSTLSVGELNSLIVVAHNQIGKLKSVLAEAEEREKARLISALEAQRRADEQLVADCIKRELEQQQNNLKLQRFQWELENREAIERELRRARAQYSDHLSHMLRLRQDELEHQFTFRLREALAQEKVAFEAALSGWIKRMEAIEDVVDGRAELDRIAKETQALWIACEALACNLSSGTPTVGDPLGRSKTTGPLTDYIEAIREAASSGSHPFALTILEQLPSDVSQNGVWIERGLKERFEKVYRVCKRVALVDETGGSLYTYALSWLHSVLTLDVFTHKFLRHWFKSSSNGELTGESELPEGVEPSQLDTFCLLRSAKAALATVEDQESDTQSDEKADDGIELAVRLLGQLQGQARLVAADWLNDARRYLETKQAAQALLAYAAARGISTYEKRL